MVHCPLCPVDVYKPTPFEETSTHLVKEHISKAVEVKEFLSLLCKLPCQTHPHYHCPTCSFTSKRTRLLCQHSEHCQAKEGEWESLWSVLLLEQGKGVRELLETLGLKRDKDVPKPVKVFKHPSILLRLTDLAVSRCRDCCEQYHCPICPREGLRAGPPQRIAQHLVNTHWNRRLSINNIHIMKCTMQSCLRNPTRFAQSHYHCPLCPKVTLSISRAREHFHCHRRGTVKKERVNSCNAQIDVSPALGHDDAQELLGQTPDPLLADSAHGEGEAEEEEEGTVEGYVELPGHFSAGEIELMEIVDEEAQNIDYSNVRYLEVDPAHEEPTEVLSNIGLVQQLQLQAPAAHQSAQLVIGPDGSAHQVVAAAAAAGGHENELNVDQAQGGSELQVYQVSGVDQTHGYIMDQSQAENEALQNQADGEQSHGYIMVEGKGQNEALQEQSSVDQSHGYIMIDSQGEGQSTELTEQSADQSHGYIMVESQGQSTAPTEQSGDQSHGYIMAQGQGQRTELQEQSGDPIQNKEYIVEAADEAGVTQTLMFHVLPEQQIKHETGKGELKSEDETMQHGSTTSMSAPVAMTRDSSTQVDSEELGLELMTENDDSGEDSEIFENVGAVLSRKFLKHIDGSRDVLLDALHKNFGLTCKAHGEAGVSMQGKWWQLACVHMELEVIQESRPRTLRQLRRILSKTQDEEEQEEEPEQSTSPEQQPPTIARRKSKNKRPNKQPTRKSKRRKVEEENDNENEGLDTCHDESLQEESNVTTDVGTTNAETNVTDVRTTNEETNVTDVRTTNEETNVTTDVRTTNSETNVTTDVRTTNEETNFTDVPTTSESTEIALVNRSIENDRQKTIQAGTLSIEQLAALKRSIVIVEKRTDSKSVKVEKDEKDSSESQSKLAVGVVKKMKTCETWDIPIKLSTDTGTEESEQQVEHENERTDSVKENALGEEVAPDDVATIKQGRITHDIDCPEAKDSAYRTCVACGVTFESRAEFIYHLLESDRMACVKFRLKDYPPKLRPELTNMKRVASTTCLFCNVRFETLNDAKVHTVLRVCRPKRHHNPRNIQKDPATGLFMCEQCNYTHKLPACVVEHMTLKHDEKHIPCNICHRMFATEKHLQRHTEFIHLNQRKSPCAVCGKEVLEKYMRKHVKDVHLSTNTSHNQRRLAEPVYCGEAGCPYSTYYADVLKKHKKRLHGVKDKSCGICGASFAFIGDLNAHQKIHEQVPGRMEAKCPKCGKVMMKQNLSTHMKTVHEQKRLFSCDLCNKSFTTKYVLNCHMETHKKPGERVYKFICDFCGAGFVNKTIYADHLNTHTGQRPYKCPTCGKSFKQTPVFHKHLELHSNVKYFCGICNEMFQNKRTYSNHKQRAHPAQALEVWTDAGDKQQEDRVLTVEQATEVLSSQNQQIVLTDEQINQGDVPSAHSLVTLADGTVVLVEGDLSQSAAEEGIVPEIVGPEGVVMSQIEQLEGPVIQIQQEEGEAFSETVQVVEENANGYECGHCREVFLEITDIQQHLETFHSDQRQEENLVTTEDLMVDDHATGGTQTFVVQS